MYGGNPASNEAAEVVEGAGPGKGDCIYNASQANLAVGPAVALGVGGVRGVVADPGQALFRVADIF